MTARLWNARAGCHAARGRHLAVPSSICVAPHSTRPSFTSFFPVGDTWHCRSMSRRLAMVASAQPPAYHSLSVFHVTKIGNSQPSPSSEAAVWRFLRAERLSGGLDRRRSVNAQRLASAGTALDFLTQPVPALAPPPSRRRGLWRRRRESARRFRRRESSRLRGRPRLGTLALAA